MVVSHDRDDKIVSFNTGDEESVVSLEYESFVLRIEYKNEGVARGEANILVSTENSGGGDDLGSYLVKEGLIEGDEGFLDLSGNSVLKLSEDISFDLDKAYLISTFYKTEVVSELTLFISY